MYVFYGGRAMCNGVAEMISESGCVCESNGQGSVIDDNEQKMKAIHG